MVSVSTTRLCPCRARAAIDSTGTYGRGCVSTKLYKNRELACGLSFPDPCFIVVRVQQPEREFLWSGSQAGEVSRKKGEETKLNEKLYQKTMLAESRRFVCQWGGMWLCFMNGPNLLLSIGWTKLKAKVTHFLIRKTLASWNMVHMSLSHRSLLKIADLEKFALF